MNIETVGHAGLLLRDDRGAPILFTDPWVTGSCYWRSWWLQNYPDDALLQELRSVPYCYITHEHPDHFHTASIRLLGKDTHYLSPEFPHGHIAPYLSSQGYQASVVPAFRWTSIHEDVQILSIPLLNDDSILLINTPRAVIVNLNDSKPRGSQLRALAKRLDVVAHGKTRVLLSSYSPASIVNSFLRRAERVSLRQKVSYVGAVSDHCRLLKIDYFLPFASQVIFKRRDSAWANDFKVTFEELARHWTGGPTQLLPPFSRLDLANGSHTFIPPERYRHEDAAIAPKVEAQEALDTVATFTDDDVERLRRKLSHCRWILALLFPRGIGFELEHTQLRYSPWAGTLVRRSAVGDFVLRVPAQAFKEAVEYGHFGDLGTTMFTMVVLNSGIHPRRVYVFFLLMTLHDYGHTTSFSNWLAWLRRSVRIHHWRIPEVGDSPGAGAEPVQG
jgi:hypothetical protein